ncbi:hypothetical protein D4R86_04320 [bacterium]|nr:MAG: hypothetical protein D4R86_04320 [bacterium]
MSEQITDFLNKIHCGDSLGLLKRLPDESVDLIITSPPYFGCRVYGNETLGREEHPLDYVNDIFEFAVQFKRVLKSTGSLYLNIGDVYFGTKGFSRNTGKYKRKTDHHYKEHKIVKNDGKYIQDKQLLLLPHRVAIKMQDDGWVLRNDIVWEKCLEENTNIFVKRKGEYQLTTIKELHNDFTDTMVTSQNAKGEFVWVKIKNVFKIGNKEGVKIITKKGNEIISTLNHSFPVKTNPKSGKYRKMKLKRAEELRAGIDKLYCNYNCVIDIPEGTEKDHLKGFFVGFFLAEGNYIYKKYLPYKDNELSRNAQKRWGKQDRGVRVKGIQLACGSKDVTRGYIGYLLKLFPDLNVNQYGNSVSIRRQSKKIVDFIKEYIEGSISSDKKITKKCYNESIQFLKGVIDGFLAGDGHYEENIKRWSVGITPNEGLKNDLQAICRILGYRFRYEGVRPIRGYRGMYFKIRMEEPKVSNFNCIMDTVDSISKIDSACFYDLELETIYNGKLGNNQYKKSLDPTTNKILSKYNNLYFLMNGIWTHNSNPLPAHSKDRRLPVKESIFHFVKSKKYYFDYPLAKELGHHRDVIRNGIEPFGNHQATFPKSLITPFILTTTKKGDVILDPFMGSGTVAVVSIENDRQYIGFELNEDYVKEAKERIEELQNTIMTI